MYEEEILNPEYDNGTMPHNVATLGAAVIGHRIVSVEMGTPTAKWYDGSTESALITLDNGQKVHLADTAHCCAYTELKTFLLHADRIDHIITGVGTTGGYTTWHIYADMGDVLELSVGWSCGNPFWYGYGFNITVTDPQND